MSAIVTVLSWFVAAFLVFGSLASVAQIGKPREPVTPGTVVRTIILAALIAWLLVTA